MNDLLLFLEQHTFDSKGSFCITYDYHSGTYIASRIGKRDELIASSVDIEGEGQRTIEASLQILVEKLKKA